jgi:CTP-dependent riboflavin kinase
VSDYLEVIDRARRMQDFEVQVTVPEDFQFSGAVPYDMEIVGDQAFVVVPAMTIEEAVQKANEFFQNTP